MVQFEAISKVYVVNDETSAYKSRPHISQTKDSYEYITSRSTVLRDN